MSTLIPFVKTGFSEGYVLVKVDTAVRELAEGSLLLELYMPCQPMSHHSTVLASPSPEVNIEILRHE
jgi:hypothetical protein